MKKYSSKTESKPTMGGSQEEGFYPKILQGYKFEQLSLFAPTPESFPDLPYTYTAL